MVRKNKAREINGYRRGEKEQLGGGAKKIRVSSKKSHSNKKSHFK